MRWFLFASALLALGTGCKRGTKPTPASPAEPESAKRAPAHAPNTSADARKDQGKKDDAPNWLKDDRFKKNKKDELPVDGGANSGKPNLGVNIAPPPGGWQPPAGAPQNPVPAPGAQNPPAQGVLQPNPVPATPPGAAQVGRKDMEDLQIFIHDSSIVMNRMPTPVEIYSALIAAGSPAAKLVKDGAIVLTGAKVRESVWAVEARAYSNGGWAVSQNGVETLTAAELKKRLGK